jgi:hypothetical protein
VVVSSTSEIATSSITSNTKLAASNAWAWKTPPLSVLLQHGIVEVATKVEIRPEQVQPSAFSGPAASIQAGVWGVGSNARRGAAARRAH